jgi:hypothetical protein
MSNISLEPFGRGDLLYIISCQNTCTILRAAYYFTTSNGYFNFIGQQSNMRSMVMIHHYRMPDCSQGVMRHPYLRTVSFFIEPANIHSFFPSLAPHDPQHPGPKATETAPGAFPSTFLHHPQFRSNTMKTNRHFPCW